jgi:N-acetylglutamate synthase-like GNAT family acetyltransferase
MRIRRATLEDCPAMLELIRELASMKKRWMSAVRIQTTEIRNNTKDVRRQKSGIRDLIFYKEMIFNNLKLKIN